MARRLLAGTSLVLTYMAAWQAEPKAESAASLAEQMAARARAEASVPALGLAVMRPGEQPVVAVSGVRIAGGQANVEPGDTWHWGSIGKSLTATLVARLAEKDVVSWSDTIGRRLGDAVRSMRDEYREVTFVHLLSHRSGLQPNIPTRLFASFAAEPSDPIADRLRWVRIALEQDPIGPKQETYEYSNNGYIVAGAMLEAATGRSWEALMREHVFAPLGLATAGFGPPRGEQPDAQPRGHRSADDKHIPVSPDADNPPALGPAGRIHMSLTDMVTYLNAHSTKRADFLSEASYNRLHTAPFGGFYAIGWVVTGPKGRWHNGSNNMWYAEVAFNTTDAAVAAVAVNDGDIKGVQPTVRALLQRLLKRPE